MFGIDLLDLLVFCVLLGVLLACAGVIWSQWRPRVSRVVANRGPLSNILAAATARGHRIAARQRFIDAFLGASAFAVGLGFVGAALIGLGDSAIVPLVRLVVAGIGFLALLTGMALVWLRRVLAREFGQLADQVEASLREIEESVANMASEEVGVIRAGRRSRGRPGRLTKAPSEPGGSPEPSDWA